MDELDIFESQLDVAGTISGNCDTDTDVANFLVGVLAVLKVKYPSLDVVFRASGKSARNVSTVG
jgi:hypothetical protein